MARRMNVEPHHSPRANSGPSYIDNSIKVIELNWVDVYGIVAKSNQYYMTVKMTLKYRQLIVLSDSEHTRRSMVKSLQNKNPLRGRIRSGIT